MFGFKKGEERRGEERRGEEKKGEERRGDERKKVQKLIFIVWFYIKFERKRNYIFFIWTNIPTIFNVNIVNKLKHNKTMN